MINSDLVPLLSYNCDRYLPVILKCRKEKQDARRGGPFAMSKCFTWSLDLDCVIRMTKRWGLEVWRNDTQKLLDDYVANISTFPECNQLDLVAFKLIKCFNF